MAITTSRTCLQLQTGPTTVVTPLVALRAERDQVGVTVMDHQSGTGDQGLYMFSRWKPQRGARGHRHVRKAIASLERDEFTVLASDLQRLQKLSAGQDADQRRPCRPLANPVHTRIASLKCNPAAFFEMAAHGLQYRQSIGVGKQDLESMSGHHDQVEAPVRLVALRRRLDPLNLFRVKFASGHSQHRRCWINTGHPVTTFGEGTAERSCTATQVEDTTGAQSREGDVEVDILRPRVSEVVNLCDLRVAIVHTPVAAATASKADFTVARNYTHNRRTGQTSHRLKVLPIA